MHTRPVSATKKKNSVELAFGVDQYFALSVSGFVTILPMTSWIGALVPLFFGDGHGGPDPGAAGGILAALAVPVMLVLPALVPCRVLRARQPHGARIEWDDDGLTEWDGLWERSSIPWNRAEVAHVETTRKTQHGGTVVLHALQIFDSATNAVITAWEEAPGSTPRRRLRARTLSDLLRALHDHGVPFSRAAAWERAEEPGRRRTKWVWLARSGYVAGLFGPLVAFPSPLPGVAIGALGSALLLWRALPVFRELRMVRARLDQGGRQAVAVDPYRGAPGDEQPGRRVADAMKYRAIVVEAIVRAAFVVLPLVSSLVSGFAAHP